MNIKFNLERPYVPLRKCGIAADVGAAMITGGTSVVSGLFGLDSADSQLEAQVSEAEKNRQFNREEAEKNRQWQSDQATTARDWQSSEWNRQFYDTNQEWNRRFNKESEQWYQQQDYSNRQSYNYWLKQQDYNSLANQVSRAQQAGINPAAALGQTFGGTGLQAAPVSVPSPSVSAPATPSSPLPSSAAASIGNTANIGVSKADAFNKMASGFSSIITSLTKGSKDIADTKYMNGIRDTLIQSAAEDLTNKQLMNTWQEMENAFQKGAIPKRLEKLTNEARLLLANASLAQTEEELKQSLIVSEQFKQEILNKESKIKSQDLVVVTAVANQIDQALKLKRDLLREQKNTEVSKQSSNYASARYVGAMAVSQEFWNDLNSEQRDTLVKSMVADLELKSEQVGVASAQGKYMSAIADIMKYKADYKEIQFWTEYAEGIASTGLDAVGEFTKLKSFKELSKVQQQKVRTDMERLSEQQRHNAAMERKKHEKYNQRGELIGYDFTTYE